MKSAQKIFMFLVISVSLLLYNPELTGQDGRLPVSKIIPVIDLIINGKYIEAEDKINTSIISDDHLKQLLQLAVKFTKIGDFESPYGSEDFLKSYNKFEKELKKDIYKNKKDPVLRYYLGTIYNYRTLVEKYRGGKLSVYRFARKGRKELQNSIDLAPDFVEPLLGIGAYNYWSGSKNIFSRITGLMDNRKKGIAQLEKLMEDRSVNYPLAANQLIWIYRDNKQTEKALNIALSMLEIYPESRFFTYPAAELYKRSGDYDNAVIYYKKVLTSLEKANLENRAIYLKMQYKLAEVLLNSDQIKEAYVYLEKIDNTNIIDDEKDMKKGILEKIDKLKKSSLKYTKK